MKTVRHSREARCCEVVTCYVAISKLVEGRLDLGTIALSSHSPLYARACEHVCKCPRPKGDLCKMCRHSRERGNPEERQCSRFRDASQMEVSPVWDLMHLSIPLTRNQVEGKL